MRCQPSPRNSIILDHPPPPSDFPFFPSNPSELQAGFTNIPKLTYFTPKYLKWFDFCTSVQLVTEGVNYDSGKFWNENFLTINGSFLLTTVQQMQPTLTLQLHEFRKLKWSSRSKRNRHFQGIHSCLSLVEIPDLKSPMPEGIPIVSPHAFRFPIQTTTPPPTPCLRNSEKPSVVYYKFDKASEIFNVHSVPLLS